MNDGSAKLELAGQAYKLPVQVGTEKEVAIDISRLRPLTGAITLDTGYGNTGSCQSRITYIDGERGVLRYRGYPIEELVEQSTFVEVAYLLIFGNLPTAAELAEFRALLADHEFIHEDMRHHFEGFPANAHPMAILSAMINACGCYQPALLESGSGDDLKEPAARLMSKVRTIVAATCKKSRGQPIIYPRHNLPYVENFLHMMFSKPNHPYAPPAEIVKALEQLLILHADHEQNCSTSTVRMVASSRANLFPSVAAGVCALWGPLHGGANQRVIQMLSEIRDRGESVESIIAKVKDKRSAIRLMGFGHRVYKSFDPRARIIKQACDTVLAKLGTSDPLLDIARQLEDVALKDEYFIERHLYPNVDFYSGIILQAIGIPLNMFTVMFAIGRMPGWIAQWREVHLETDGCIYRPRQLYIGETQRSYVPVHARG